MRDKIEKILALQGCEGYDAIGEIIALIAPELEKAGKWDKIAQITSGEDRCTICIIGNKCDEPEEWEGLPCEILRHIIKALEGESHGRTRHNP